MCIEDMGHVEDSIQYMYTDRGCMLLADLLQIARDRYSDHSFPVLLPT